MEALDSIVAHLLVCAVESWAQDQPLIPVVQLVACSNLLEIADAVAVVPTADANSFQAVCWNDSWEPAVVHAVAMLRLLQPLHVDADLVADNSFRAVLCVIESVVLAVRVQADAAADAVLQHQLL